MANKKMMMGYLMQKSNLNNRFHCLPLTQDKSQHNSLNTPRQESQLEKKKKCKDELNKLFIL